jgi:hypothetical protein
MRLQWQGKLISFPPQALESLKVVKQDHDYELLL